jgi:CelD/BcsL family acetyltransferase involved in cellulose biosynthesis
VFHSPGWLAALGQTFGYVPFVLCTAPPGTALTGGLPVCLVKSWTGNRLVSLPFSDHCEPLVDGADERREILAFLKDGTESRRWKSVELRPRETVLPCDGDANDLQPVHQYCFHKIDLAPPLDELYERLHHSCVRRAIRRAEREGLVYEAGSSPDLLANFYQLMRQTRRRHGLPPQPYAWFESLIARLGERLTIRLATKSGKPVAAMMSLTFHRTIVYKYGCSDARYHKLGGMAYLFWRAIREAKEQGLKEFDLGRTDLDQSGLIAFKDRLGASRSTLTYYRRPAGSTPFWKGARKQRAARWLFERLPDPALSLAGQVLYRHLG